MDVCFTASTHYPTKGPSHAVRQENSKGIHVRKEEAKLSYSQTT